MNKLIVDTRHTSADEKHAFLEQHARDQVVMDFSTLDPSPFYAQYPQLFATFPGQFTVRGRCELHVRRENPGIEEALKLHGLQVVLTSTASLGFTVPRTLALIINEAFFALEEKVSTASDIDRAMRFGVNYPQGPFEWARGREALYVELLERLQEATGNTRYAPAPSLRANASKSNPS